MILALASLLDEIFCSQNLPTALSVLFACSMVWRAISLQDITEGVQQDFREESVEDGVDFSSHSSRSLKDAATSTCPPPVTPLQDFDLANFISAPWYAQAMVRMRPFSRSDP